MCTEHADAEGATDAGGPTSTGGPAGTDGTQGADGTAGVGNPGAVVPAAGEGPTTVPPETVVPEGETPAAVCPYCDRPFPETDLRDLHVGRIHAERCTGAEEAAFEDARDAEDDTLFMYHLRVIGALGVTYAILVLIYMVVLAG